jgi:hypothetical protein
MRRGEERRMGSLDEEQEKEGMSIAFIPKLWVFLLPFTYPFLMH